MARPLVPRGLRVVSILLALSALGLLAVPITIMAALPDVTTRAGRHAVAGALGLTALALVEFLLAVIPIRRGERWAMYAAAVPFVIVGIPVLVVDAEYVARERLWNTLAPQFVGLILGISSLFLCLASTRVRRPGRRLPDE